MHHSIQISSFIFQNLHDIQNSWSDSKKDMKGAKLKGLKLSILRLRGQKNLNTKDVHTFGIGEVVEFLSTVRQKGNFTLQMIELNM